MTVDDGMDIHQEEVRAHRDPWLVAYLQEHSSLPRNVASLAKVTSRPGKLWAQRPSPAPGDWTRMAPPPLQMDAFRVAMR